MSTFVMAGGGTGGHILPALAVARELRERGHDVHFIGVQTRLEAQLVPAANFPIHWIDIGGLNRVGLFQALKGLLKLPASVTRAAGLLRRIRPAAVFSTGGYVAGPVLLAALIRRIPVVIMEPNVVPGFTHRVLARWISRALVSFPETLRWFPVGRAEITGLPVRREFFALPARPPQATLTLLITGGSQGSQRLNRVVRESWPLWGRSALGGRVRLLHQTGKAMFGELQRGFAETHLPGEVTEFLLDMPRAFGAADIVLARSGMGTVSELAASGKPSILVPLPTAADDHQLKNAQALVGAGAACLVLDSEISGTRLVEEVARLAAEPESLKRMAHAARGFAHPRAAARAAGILEAVANESPVKSRQKSKV